ncbi:MAG TPA: hypothetical protein VH681_12395 [Nitrospiraceae bacterium]
MPLRDNTPARWLAILCLACLPTAALISSVSVASSADDLTVKTDPHGGVRATAQILFSAKPEILQSILTDYARWPDLFEVQMKVASLNIDHGVATTDLRIEHMLLPGERRLVCESKALPSGGLITDLKAGDFKQYHRVWKLNPVGDGNQTQGEFELIVEIESMVPDWLVAMTMRRELEAHFRILKDKALMQTREGR